MAKQFSQACENNRQPILEVLARQFSQTERVLEIGSGTGQHGVFFSAHLPHLIWQTSDLAASHPSINAWMDDEPRPNLRRPLLLDVDSEPWPDSGFDGLFSANTCHIMAWESVVNFFAGVGRHLAVGGTCCIYGPFNYRGSYTSASNARFDQWLKSQFPHQGIRDFEAVDKLALQAGLILVEDNAMPANNRLLVWRKASWLRR